GLHTPARIGRSPALSRYLTGLFGRSQVRKSNLGTLLRWFVPLFRPYWLRQTEITVYMLLGLAYSLAMPLSSKFLIDTIIPCGNAQLLATFVIVLLIV